jgi:hypothetical protein
MKESVQLDHQLVVLLYFWFMYSLSLFKSYTSAKSFYYKNSAHWLSFFEFTKNGNNRFIDKDKYHIILP